MLCKLAINFKVDSSSSHLALYWFLDKTTCISSLSVSATLDSISLTVDCMLVVSESRGMSPWALMLPTNVAESCATSIGLELLPCPEKEGA